MAKKATNTAPTDLDEMVDPTAIIIKGARSNNLKNVDLRIPKNKLVVVTGVSGSGKSSITMDTLYAEGQRRYVESLSSYARQFLGRMKKPDVDYIRGICPAIAIEQRVTTGNNRSTVGSMTEVNEFLRLLFARIGQMISPISGQVVKKHEVTDVVDFCKNLSAGTRGLILAPFSTKHAERSLELELKLRLQKGFTRVQFGGETLQIEDILDKKHSEIGDISQSATLFREKNLALLIDRFAASDDEANLQRIADSVSTAFGESDGECQIWIVGEANPVVFNNRFELDGIEFPELSPQLFNYNNPFGACPTCEGYGKTMGIDHEKVVPDPSKSMASGAIAPWKGETLGWWLEQFLATAHRHNFPVHTPWKDLSRAEQKLVWAGNAHFEGIDAFFKDLESKTYKIQNRVMLARYRGRTICPTCDGARLRIEATYVKVAGKSIHEFTEIPIGEVADFFKTINLTAHEMDIARRLLVEINGRFDMLTRLGLGYLTLDRISSTLSGGETQRINLTRTLNSNLTQSMYLLDEPSVGLHPRDTGRLVTVLKNLRDLGNTVIVVEHEEDVIKNGDYLVDMGPAAGHLGGEVVFAGDYKDIYNDATESLTTKYMSGRMRIELPKKRRLANHFIEIKGAKQHNLKDISVRIPTGCLTVVSGVSGSGKTTLVRDILYPALAATTSEPSGRQPGLFDGLEGTFKKVTAVEMINQSPIGKSSRSNPVTYVKAWDFIRDLFSGLQLSKIRGFLPKHFSFNVEGGRCETCKGEGELIVEMQFLADVRLECEECRGRRFRQEVLDVQYKGKNIFEILQMSVDEALEFFVGNKDIINRLQPLSDVGLGYVQLGQSSSTLSGGEAQRVKLASFLIGGGSASGHIFFVFDEPTTGLHFHDIQKLLIALQALVEKGHTVLVVEHNMEVIKSADWVIDLGPEGGKEGGFLVFEGTPEGLAACGKGHTSGFLKEKLE